MVKKRHNRSSSEPSSLAVRGLRIFAAALLITYIAWNALWFSQGRLAPSLFMGLTGLPGPTTGFTRSLLQLLHGNIIESLRFHPFTIPIILMAIATVASLLRNGAQKQQWRIDQRLLIPWLLLILIGWVIKLAASPAYW